MFYDNDILEEKAILDWASKISKKYVSKEISTQIHDKAKPFVQWLQEAEEEDSSDDDGEDSEVDIEYDDRANVESLKKEAVIKKNVSKPVEEDGEDIDIDDI